MESVTVVVEIEHERSRHTFRGATAMEEGDDLVVEGTGGTVIARFDTAFVCAWWREGETEPETS